MAGSIFVQQQQQQLQPQELKAKKLLLFALLCCVGLASAKHLGDGDMAAANDNHLNVHHQHQQHHQQQHHQHQHSAVTHHRRRLQRDSRAKDTAQCEAVKGYFESINIRSSGIYNEKGAICGGNCCNNATEQELLNVAAGKFEQLLHHHTSSLRGILETTASQFQSHVLELAEQSENKTLSVFSKVYRRMVPLSRQLIHELYTEIINHLKYTSNYSSNNGQGNSKLHSQTSLKDALHRFFEQLFPVAYHQAVHLTPEQNYVELHDDYINCLKHNFDDLQPFGAVPTEIQNTLLQSVHMSNIFMIALLQSAEVLSEADALYGKQLTDTCKLHLLKMHYCPNCNGYLKQNRPKVCYSYCMNVMHGCSALYSGQLDNPWSSVVDAMDNLMTTHIRSENGIMNVIKQLDAKLSEAIMKAMENGPELEKKVKATCGKPTLIPSLTAEDRQALDQHSNFKWAMPPETTILNFLTTLQKSKEFYSNIVYNFCDEDSEKNDHLCWTGDRVGDYAQQLMMPATDRQRYNPEVPWESQPQLSKINELADKLIKIRSSIGVSMPVNSAQMHNDIQSDMGHEGSGGGGGGGAGGGANISDDEEEYNNSMHGSGDGSGYGPTHFYDPAGTTPITNNDIESRENSKGASSALTATATCLLLTLVTLYSSCS